MNAEDHTFNIRYYDYNWDKIMFASGDLTV